jgi:HAE1 family hydrophobic/amphiphilic exporter-1
MNLIKTAISRPVTVAMFVVAVILFGVVSLDRLALNLLPDISYPSLTVQTDYPDAAPEEVENLLTRPIEEAVGVVSGLTRLSSVSRSGQSEVVLEFGWDTDMNLAALDVREKLGFVTLPRDSERHMILRFDPSYDPIMRLRFRGAESLTQLRYLADRDFKKALESTDGVAAVKVIGGIEEQIRVAIDEKRLAEMGIPITEVTQALGRENLNQAA